MGLAIVVSIGTASVRAQDYPVIVAPGLRDADRQTDKRRDPVNLLTFTGAKAGWTVLDMGADAGYSTELMARSVGPTGKVFDRMIRTTTSSAPMTKLAMGNVVALVRPADDSVPADLHDIDLLPSTSPITTRPTWGSIVRK